MLLAGSPSFLVYMYDTPPKYNLLLIVLVCEFLVRQLSELLAQVKDEQTYIVVRERTHRNTAESTNARVKWWSIFQLGVLIGEGVFQVWWLKRFFEVNSRPLP